MKLSTMKCLLLAFVLAAALPLAACSDDDTPTSPTQPGPPVGEQPTPPPTQPPPDDDDDDDDDDDTDDRPIETITGTIANLARSGEGDLDASFRIDDRTIARVSRTTPVTSGSQTGDTNFLREGQTVTVQGRRTNGFLDATSVNIIAEAQ